MTFGSFGGVDHTNCLQMDNGDIDVLPAGKTKYLSDFGGAESCQTFCFKLGNGYNITMMT